MNIASIKARVKSWAYVHGIVYRWWFTKLQFRMRLTRKIKIGFGPVTSCENDLAERKWRIDPIVNCINQKSSRYAAGIFFKPDEMAQFDLIVIVKKFNPTYFDMMNKLKNLGKRFVYDIIDNPNCGPPHDFYYLEHAGLMSNMHGFILSTPLHSLLLADYKKPTKLIEHPVIHDIYKKSYHSDKPVTILAHGYYENLKIIKWLEPMIESISKSINQKIILCYHSEVVLPDTDCIKYVKWTVQNSFTIMENVDIAVSIKRLDILHQKTKPSTKIIAFMAAGLPVVCFPSVADRMIINHGVNGFFAYNENDWIDIIKALATNPLHRRQIGRAARAHVMERYSVPAMTKCYTDLFDEVVK